MNLYNSYSFKDKDPMIDVLRTALQDDGIDWRDLPEFVNVSYATYKNWFEGRTLRPSLRAFAVTVQALPTSTQRLIWSRIVVEGISKAAFRTMLKAAA